MKNITQTILLGLALCCLMVSNGFGQITEWQMIRAKYTVMRYCELITKYGYAENTEVAQDLERLFVNNNSMIFNAMNEKEPYLNLADYLKQIDKQRNNDFAITFVETLQTVKLDSADFFSFTNRRNTQYITATITQNVLTNGKNITKTLLVSVYPYSGKIYNITKQTDNTEKYEKLSEKELMANLEFIPTNQPNFQVIIDKLVEKGNCYGIYRNIFRNNEKVEDQNKQMYDLALKGCDYAQVYITSYVGDKSFSEVIKSRTNANNFETIYAEAQKQRLDWLKDLANKGWEVPYYMVWSRGLNNKFQYLIDGAFLGYVDCAYEVFVYMLKNYGKKRYEISFYKNLCRLMSDRYIPLFQYELSSTDMVNGYRAGNLLALARISGNKEAFNLVNDYSSNYDYYTEWGYLKDLKKLGYKEVIPQINAMVNIIDSLESDIAIPENVLKTERDSLFSKLYNKNYYKKATTLILKYPKQDSVERFGELAMCLLHSRDFLESESYFVRYTNNVFKSNSQKRTHLVDLSYFALYLDKILDPDKELGLAKQYFEKILNEGELFIHPAYLISGDYEQYYLVITICYKYLLSYYKIHKADLTIIAKYEKLLKETEEKKQKYEPKQAPIIDKAIYDKAKVTVKQYCELLTSYSQVEDMNTINRFKKLFLNENNLVFNNLNTKTPQTSLNYYIRDIELQRSKETKIEVMTATDSVELEPYYILSENESGFKATVKTITTLKNKQKTTHIAEILLNKDGSLIVNTFDKQRLGLDEVQMTATDLADKSIVIYNNGNVEKAITLMKKAIQKNGDLTGLYMFELGNLYHELKDYKNAFNLYKQCFDRGYKRGAVTVGAYYKDGYIEKNYAKSLEYYELETVNITFSCTAIGEMYVEGGFGIEKDYSKAMTWYLKGINSYKNTQVREGLDEPYIILNKCQEHIARLYYNGWGVEKDLNKAFSLYKQAAENSSNRSMGLIGFMYLKGQGVEKNEKEAEKWLLKAHNKGDIDASIDLAVYYNNKVSDGDLTYLDISMKMSRVAAKHNADFKKDKEAMLNVADFSTDEKYKINYQDTLTYSWTEIALNAYSQWYYDDATELANIALKKNEDKKRIFLIFAHTYYFKNNVMLADKYCSDAILLYKKEIKETENTEKNVSNILDYLKLLDNKVRISRQIDKTYEIGLGKSTAEELLRICDLPLLVKITPQADILQSQIPVYKQLGNEYLAKYYQKNKQTDKAIFHYEKLLEITPEDQEAKKALETLKAEKKR